MRILVTGASGFIGSAFTRHALGQGHSIGALLRSPTSVPANLPSHDQMQFFRGTLADAPWREIERFQPDVCVHTAWITTPGTYLESPENERFRDTSLTFLRKAVDVGLRHIVSLGTCIEYRITREPLSEEHTPIAPTTTYARCKNELRIALEAEAQARGFTLCWGRVFYPYGPGEHPSRLFSSIIQKIRNGEQVILKTPNSTKDYIYIDDLASAILRTVECRFTGTINWGTGVGTPVRQIADTIATALHRPDLITTNLHPAPDPFPNVVADIHRLLQQGWQQTVDLEEGIRTFTPRSM